MNSTPTSQQMSTESPLVIHTGSLLSNLDQETQVRVLESRYMKSPLVEGKTPYAVMIQQALKEVSYFDIELGCFIRTKLTGGPCKLGPMGTVSRSGYVQIMIKRFTFYQSNLVVLWFTGKFPKSNEEIDHIDGVRNNDSITNLRVVLKEFNRRNLKKYKNNTSNYTGVCYDKNRGKYAASITVNKKRIYLGSFLTEEIAASVRTDWINAHPELGFTSRHGI